MAVIAESDHETLHGIECIGRADVFATEFPSQPLKSRWKGDLFGKWIVALLWGKRLRRKLRATRHRRRSMVGSEGVRSFRRFRDSEKRVRGFGEPFPERCLRGRRWRQRHPSGFFEDDGSSAHFLHAFAGPLPARAPSSRTDKRFRTLASLGCWQRDLKKRVGRRLAKDVCPTCSGAEQQRKENPIVRLKNSLQTASSRRPMGSTSIIRWSCVISATLWPLPNT
ncbi:hypothetical protein MAMC_01714 [Methylacidimicrobium cyclopophantes]|uniref:Uncharacterized protein n=1 Tax=Methylacidimicrobium cyclopophantes TaxID=1041766 RepID=A0A5E6MH95_9BACT|nr:hypothetical protein MAMC_01714 [Methylacidimicrobium cyclopophantes]